MQKITSNTEAKNASIGTVVLLNADEGDVTRVAIQKQEDGQWYFASDWEIPSRSDDDIRGDVLIWGHDITV
jgi:hypothetical protein